MRHTLMTSVAAIALAAVSVQAASAQESLTIGADVDAGTLDPRLARDTTAYRVANLISAGLVHLTPNLEAVPDLAESWENPDDTTVVFTLREGLTFSDGSALTAEDVVYTFETILDADFNAPQRGLFTPIESIVAVDDRTVQFNLTTPYAPLMSYLDIGIVPSDYEGDMAVEPIGAGPMVLDSWTRGSELVLTASESYWAGAPSVSNLVVTVVGDNSARAQAFEAGDLDVIQSPLSPNDIQRFADDDSVGSEILAGLGVTYLNFNTSDPLLSDPAMRQALAMLVDQDTIVNQIYEGVDQVASSVILPSSWAYDEAIQQPGFDIAAAMAMLDDMGWSDSDGDGFRDRDGETLSIEIATHSEDPNRVQSVEYLQAIFESAGIDATVRITDWPSFSSGYVQQGEHQIALLGWLRITDPDRLLYGQLTTGSGLNWGGYSNPEVDALLEAGRTELDQDARAEAYQAAATIIAEELPYYIISYQGYQMFYDPEVVSDVVATPRGGFRGLIGMAD